MIYLDYWVSCLPNVVLRKHFPCLTLVWSIYQANTQKAQAWHAVDPQQSVPSFVLKDFYQRSRGRSQLHEDHRTSVMKKGREKRPKADSTPLPSWGHPVWDPQHSGRVSTHVPMKNDSHLTNSIEHWAKRFACTISFNSHSTLKGGTVLLTLDDTSECKECAPGQPA